MNLAQSSSVPQILSKIFYWKISDLVWWIFVWNSMQLFPKWWLSLPSLILFSYSNLTSHILILLPHCSKLHIHTLMNQNKNKLLLLKKYLFIIKKKQNATCQSSQSILSLLLLILHQTHITYSITSWPYSYKQISM